LIRKIIWPDTFEKGNPFGGRNGIRPLSLTFHSEVYEKVSPEEIKALEILYEICGANRIDIMSFDGKVFPKIVFGKPDNVESSDITVINEDGRPVLFTGIYPSRISKDQIIWIMGMYSSNRQDEFDNAREEIIQVESHYALRRDIFVTTSPFLLKNRDKLSESNIRSPLEALKVVGLYIRFQNEHEWISEIKGNGRILTSNHGFFEDLTRGLLPSNWRFLRYIPSFLDIEDEKHLGISVLNRCSRALQARDELARLFYMPGEYGSSDKRTYHFDYLTLLLTGALDALALVLNRVHKLQLSPIDCSMSPFRDKFKKMLIVKTSASNIVHLIEAASTKPFLEILYRIRNRIHSISLNESMSVPQDNVDELLDWIYDFDPNDHCGMSKEKVIAYINNDPPVPHYDIKIDKYLLASTLLAETLKLVDRIMDLVAPKDVNGEPPPNMLRSMERYKFLG
jgi:hypothetical protein